MGRSVRAGDGLRRRGARVNAPPDRALAHPKPAAASPLLAKGANPRTVMEQLGHSTVTLTANTYAHIAPELLRDEVARMDEALG